MLVNLDFNIKHTADTLEATKGILLYSCCKCGAHQRIEPHARNGVVDVWAPDYPCFKCGGNEDINRQWQYSPQALQILRLQGLLGWWLQVKAWTLEIRDQIIMRFFKKPNP